MTAKSSISGFKKQEITQLLRSARRVLKHPGFDILIAPAAFDHGRILVITSAKIGSAVARNTFRRRIKEIFRKEHLAKKNFDWIIIAKKAGIDLCSDELKKNMLQVKETL